MLQQVRNPFRIQDIGLATRQGLQVLRVDHQDFKLPFQKIEDGFPVHAGALHRQVRALSRHQPIAQGQKFLGHGSKRARFFVAFTVRIHDQQTGHDRLLMDVQSTAARINNLHGSPPGSPIVDRPTGGVPF